MTHPAEQLTVQEGALAAAMVYRLGNTTVAHTVHDGSRSHAQPNVSTEQFDSLVGSYAKDPKEHLAYARESLFALTRDNNLSDEEKGDRLDSFLDAYFDLTIKLDHAAFPSTPGGKTIKGVPEYIPDGFIDMGNDGNIDTLHRDREQIWVDKRAMLEKNKDIIKSMFFSNIAGMDLELRKKTILVQLAKHVYANMVYNHDYVNGDQLGVDKKKISELSDGVCRHQALAFQVLAQAMGLKTRLLKCYWAGDKHAANMARVNGEWYLIDVTNPDYVKQDDGLTEWRPGTYKVDGPPQPGESKTYQVKQKFSGDESTYIAHDKMFWRIEHP